MPIKCRLFAQYDIKQKAGKKMEAYTGFASVYDMFMDNIPYEEWCEYIVDLLDTYGVEKESIIADLGCGTGKITELLSKHGYDMIGIDNAEEMRVGIIPTGRCHGKCLRQYELYYREGRFVKGLSRGK